MIVPTLRPELFPSSVRRLGVHGFRTSATFADDVVFSRITEVKASIPLRFSATAFPSLRYLHLILDRRATMLRRLSSLRSLTALGLTPFNSSAIWEAIEPLELDWLAAFGTRSVHSIEGIERLKNLDSLHLWDFPRVTRLEPLCDLPNLRELRFSWCYHIDDYEILLRLPKLESVEFWFCDVKKVDEIRPALQAKGVRVHPSGEKIQT